MFETSDRFACSITSSVQNVKYHNWVAASPSPELNLVLSFVITVTYSDKHTVETLHFVQSDRQCHSEPCLRHGEESPITLLRDRIYENVHLVLEFWYFASPTSASDRTSEAIEQFERLSILHKTLQLLAPGRVA